MNTTTIAVKQPSPFKAIRSGAETVASHIYLILFPIALDLYLLFGTRFTVSKAVNNLLAQVQLPANAAQDLMVTWNGAVQMLKEYFTYFSLTSVLRTLPFGIPSLLAGQALTTNPLSRIKTTELTSSGQISLWFVVFSLIGLLAATFYYKFCAMAVNKQARKISFSQTFNDFASNIALPMLTIIFLAIVLLPGLLIIGILSAITPFLGTIGYLIVLSILISIFLPLFFTPFATALYGEGFLKSVLLSIQTFRPTGPATSIFIFLAISSTYLTNLLWQSAPDDSWMLLVGIFGHALITTILVASSFHLFIEAISNVRMAFQPVQPS